MKLIQAIIIGSLSVLSISAFADEIATQDQAAVEVQVATEAQPEVAVDVTTTTEPTQDAAAAEAQAGQPNATEAAASE